MSHDKKFSLWSLLTKYNKIEVPIIQRDYAQGRETKEVGKIRKDFVNYLVKSIVNNTPVELDFIYGIKDDTLFTPLDGQQRLTTLFLLHWYIAYREDILVEVKDILIKFTYETRASSHDFMTSLCTIVHPKVDKITSYVKEKASWFDSEWLLDPSVSGMLTMLECIENNELLNSNLGNLFERITSENKLISFYFLPLEEFGLSDDLYIRMNARGKILNEFENFKSNFYRIIKDYPKIDQIKTKMEYDWVDNLWGYRKDKNHEFVVDRYFMNYLEYITKMLYYHYHQTGQRDRANISFRDLDLFNTIYSDHKRTNFLEFCYDILPLLSQFKAEKKWFWDESLAGIFNNCLKAGKIDNSESLLLYGALLFCYRNNKSFDGLEDFLRVLRNLIYNTDDISEREWRRILASIDRLVFDNTDEQMNIYSHLCNNEINLEGFYVPQKNEEVLKAKLKCIGDPELAEIINFAEDNEALHGNILRIIKVSYTDDESIIRKADAQNIPIDKIDKNTLRGIVHAYDTISQDDFNNIFGDLITSSLYSFYRQYMFVPSIYDLCRCVFEDEYAHHPATILFARDLHLSGKDLNDYINFKEASFILNIPDVHEVTDMKSQLYILYIISKHILKLPLNGFFKNGFNFGCTDETTRRFSKPFKEIEGTQIKNPIFQSFKSQFQYNRGLLDQRIPDIYWHNNEKYIASAYEWAKSVVKVD